MKVKENMEKYINDMSDYFRRMTFVSIKEEDDDNLSSYNTHQNRSLHVVTDLKRPKMLLDRPDLSKINKISTVRTNTSFTNEKKNNLAIKKFMNESTINFRPDELSSYNDMFSSGIKTASRFFNHNNDKLTVSKYTTATKVSTNSLRDHTSMSSYRSSRMEQNLQLANQGVSLRVNLNNRRFHRK